MATVDRRDGMMNRREILVDAAAPLAAGLAGIGSADAAGEVPIGAVYPMSGAAAQAGVDGRHAVETAMEIVNGVHDLDLPGARTAGLGGAQIRLVVADHQGDPQNGRSEPERLITQDKLVGQISRGSFALDLAPKRPSIGLVNVKARAGRDLNDDTSRLVEAMLVIADAIDRAKSTDGTKVRDALTATDIPGIQTVMPWRDIKFGPDGQNTLCDPVLIQYREGKFVNRAPEGLRRSGTALADESMMAIGTIVDSFPSLDRQVH